MSSNLGREEIVEVLLKNGAKVNHKDKKEKSPLDIAIEKGTIKELFLVYKQDKL